MGVDRRANSLTKAMATILIAVCALLNAQCDVFEASDGGVVDPLDSRIGFWIGETYPEYDYVGEPSLVLFMTTEKEYPCCNYSIANMVVRGTDMIVVELLGIHKPSMCLTAIGPATSRSKLSLTPGKYTLYFSHDEGVDEFSVTLTDSSISVAGDTSRYTVPSKPLVWRYPPRSFAYLCGTRTEESWICSEFLDSLLVAGLYEEYHFPDSGYIPYPGSSAGHYYDMPAMYFRYENEVDFEEAGAILERYAKTTTYLHSGVGLSLISWRNKGYYSWMLEE